MKKDPNNFGLVLKTFEMEPKEEPTSDEELLDMLSDQLAYMIEYRMEFLLSLMYRMDVREDKINYALSPICPEPANRALAQLILDRHKQRMHTKADIEVEKIEDLEEGLEW